MTEYYLGADLGGTHTRALIADPNGRCLGWGVSGPGNHEVVGYDGFRRNLHLAVEQAMRMARIDPAELRGAGFGVGGYDWPIEEPPSMAVIQSLGLPCPLKMVNDVDLGLLAGSPRGWGVALVAGTGCNCRGWDETHSKFGRVTGAGTPFGENAGASELVARTQQVLAYAWTGRCQPTALTAAFCRRFSVSTEAELLQGLACQTFALTPDDARLVFQVADQGDAQAREIIAWAGRELGEMALCVIRQVQIQSLDFDLVLIGSLWKGGPLLADEMRKIVLAGAPRANILSFDGPPVIGAVLLGMPAQPDTLAAAVRGELMRTVRRFSP